MRCIPQCSRWLLALAVLSVPLCPVMAGDGRVPLPPITEGRGDQCVEPTPVMRRDHMTFLFHQRDATVHRGIRTKRHSLTGCVGCHVSRDAEDRSIPINAPGQFCQSCHAYAAVTIDCFQCHATTPDSGGVEPSATETIGAAEVTGFNFHSPPLSTLMAEPASGELDGQ